MRIYAHKANKKKKSQILNMQTATENHKEVNKNKNLFLKTRHIYRN